MKFSFVNFNDFCVFYTTWRRYGVAVAALHSIEIYSTRKSASNLLVNFAVFPTSHRHTQHTSVREANAILVKVQSVRARYQPVGSKYFRFVESHRLRPRNCLRELKQFNLYTLCAAAAVAASAALLRQDLDDVLRWAEVHVFVAEVGLLQSDSDKMNKE